MHAAARVSETGTQLGVRQLEQCAAMLRNRCYVVDGADGTLMNLPFLRVHGTDVSVVAAGPLLHAQRYLLTVHPSVLCDPLARDIVN